MHKAKVSMMAVKGRLPVPRLVGCQRHVLLEKCWSDQHACAACAVPIDAQPNLVCCAADGQPDLQAEHAAPNRAALLMLDVRAMRHQLHGSVCA